MNGLLIASVQIFKAFLVREKGSIFYKKMSEITSIRNRRLHNIIYLIPYDDTGLGSRSGARQDPMGSIHGCNADTT